MSGSRDTSSGWSLADQCDQPSSLRSPQERNLLQFSAFTGREESPRVAQGRFRRVMTTVSGSNGPMHLTNLTSRQLSQMSSSDSGETVSQSLPQNPNIGTASRNATSPVSEEQGTRDQGSNGSDDIAASYVVSNGPPRIGSHGISNMSTASLDPAALRGKRSWPRSGRRKEVSSSKQQRAKDVDSTRDRGINSNGDSGMWYKEDNGPRSAGSRGFPSSSTTSSDPVALRAKRSWPRSARRRDMPGLKLSGLKLSSDIEASRISTQSKGDSSEHNSAQSMGSGKAEANGSGNGVVRGVDAATTKKVSPDGKMIRKISGLLSLTKPVSRRGSQPELGTDNGSSAEDAEAEQGALVRRGSSLLGLFGRKEKLPQRKRSFLRSPRRVGRKRSEDLLSCDHKEESKEFDVVVEESDKDESRITEDELAKRAVQIEKFLNSVAFS